jgi:hypothetical protein
VAISTYATVKTAMASHGSRPLTRAASGPAAHPG